MLGMVIGNQSVMYYEWLSDRKEGVQKKPTWRHPKVQASHLSVLVF